MLRSVLSVVVASTLALACASTEEEEEQSSESAAVTSSNATSDPNATPETKTVFANLRSFGFQSVDPFDRRLMIGQQESDVSNRTTNGVAMITPDMTNVTGKAPSLVSYELSHAYKGSTSMFDPVAFRAGRNALRELVIDKHKKGVLVSLVWHLRCPKSAATESDKFAPNECPADYNLEELLERKANGARGAHFDEWRAMLDELAEFLWSLKDEQGQLIPVQLRPFHEFTGNWFWWGTARNRPAAWIAAWREMVTYLRNGRGLHDVLWVFCPAAPTNDLFASYYPGDAYTDVIGFDAYDFGDGRFEGEFRTALDKVGSFAQAHGKVAAVTEIGTDFSKRGLDADRTWFTRTMLPPISQTRHPFAYAAIWRNAPWEKFLPEPGDGPIADDLRSLANDQAVLMSGKHDLYLPLHVPSS